MIIEKRIKDFKKLGFGMFVHFGLYSQLEKGEWAKHADTTAYIENGEVVIELIHRMSCEQAAYVFKKHSIDPFDLLNTLETLQKYNNPAEKYTALAKMTMLLKKLHTRGE